MSMNVSMQDAVNLAKKWTGDYARTHKGKTKLIKKVILKGYIIATPCELFGESFLDDAKHIWCCAPFKKGNFPFIPVY